MESPRRFLASFAVLVGGAMLGVFAINLIVDPYDVWRVVVLRGVNETKPEQIFHDRMHKAWEIRHARPDALLLGTSRTQVGLNPHSPAFAGKADDVVNAALSDGQPYEALRYLQHAHALRPQKIVLVGLDFLSFDVTTTPNVEYDDRRLAVDEEGDRQWLSPVVDFVPTLLTEDALRSSVRTVRKQGQPSYFHVGGQRDTRFMEERVVEQGGQRGNMLHSERGYLVEYACAVPPSEETSTRTLDDLRRLVRFARDHDVALRLFFSPSHVRSQLVVMQAGLWEAQQRWRRDVVRLVEEEAGDGDVEVWDFVGAGRYTGEPVPPKDDAASRMDFYWESSHYKSALGELVLARLLGLPTTEATRGFGVRLTSGNVDVMNARVDAEIAAWIERHPEDVREIAALASEVLPAARAEPGCGVVPTLQVAGGHP